MENKKSIFDDNRIIFLLSLILAWLLWLTATSAIEPDAVISKNNIPVTVDVQDSALVKLGLNAIQENVEYVDVSIEGERMVIGNVNAEDILIKADLSGITAPGIYSVDLIGEDVNSNGFEVVSIEPSTIELKFDRLSSEKFTVELDVSGIEIPAGYYLEDEIVLPSEVTISGPEVDMERVDRAVVTLELEDTLTTTETFNSVIELRDRENNLVDTTHLNMDYTSVDITLPVLKIKEVPVTVSFLNVPQGFPIDDLEYAISNETIRIAGSQDRVDNFSEVNLGYIDLKNLMPVSTFAYDVVLPSGFVNIDNIETVLVEFEMDEMITRNFVVDNINVINPPANYDVTVFTERITGVSMFGEEDVLTGMTSDDIVAEINLSGSEISAGQMSVPVTISAPSKGIVWANGNYQVIVTISEKDE